MGKMGDTWRGVETITKTDETDQGVTWSYSSLPDSRIDILEHKVTQYIQYA